MGDSLGDDINRIESNGKDLNDDINRIELNGRFSW